MKHIEIDEECFIIFSLKQHIETVQDQFLVELKNDALYHVASGIECTVPVVYCIVVVYLYHKKSTPGELKSGNVLVTGG